MKNLPSSLHLLLLAMLYFVLQGDRKILFSWEKRKKTNAQQEKRQGVGLSLGMGGGGDVQTAATVAPQRQAEALTPQTAPPQPLEETVITSARTNADQYSISHLVVLVQGPARMLGHWKQRLRDAGVEKSVLLVYASFDKPAKDPECDVLENGQWSSFCRTLFIPDTTWTEGRNELVKYAHCEEQIREQEFRYWIFSDDDVELECHIPDDMATTTNNLNGTVCWTLYFDFLDTQMLSSQAVFYALRDAERFSEENQKGIIITAEVDAIINAFDRRYIKMLMPYVFMKKDDSWWMSQMMQFSLVHRCFGAAGIVPLFFNFVNDLHRDYPRGLELEKASLLLHQNYEQYMGVDFFRGKFGIYQYEHKEGPFLDVATAAVQVRKQLENSQASCGNLTQRFHDWEDSWGTCIAFQQRLEEEQSHPLPRKPIR
ncbi:unnamed protein product [Cylindrotheca closterium]|uniref:Glycosyltransferase family 92 protein n=1 Tax=Cylindrotheca closterium TaxID=2856 RepID=A0AAD2JJ34_9STRA|nr:unnamed protein product [Cylindrotheca closterium]